MNKKKRKIIKPCGPRDSRIVVLGEAGGAQEEKEGEPFVGPSGGILFDNILRPVSIHKTRVLCLNVCWVRPPANKLHRLPKKNRLKWEERTWKVINAHPRDVIIAVGGTALKFLLGEEKLAQYVGEKLASSDGGGISLMRGSPLMSLHGHRVIPMLHPASLLHEKGARYRDIHLCQMDAFKARRWIDGEGELPVFNIHNFERIHQAKSQQGFEPQLRTFQHFKAELEKLRSAPVISFDIETFADTITVLGLAADIREGISIPLTGEFTAQQEVELLGIVKEILEGPALKVAQNIEFDCDYLAEMGIGVKNFWMDTLAAHQNIHPETRHSLAMLVSIYTDQPYYKDMTKDAGWDKYTETLWDYNGMDCCLTLEVAYKIFQEQHERGALGLYETRARGSHSALIRSSAIGVNIDQKRREAMAKKTEHEQLLYQRRLKRAWGVDDLFGPKGHISPVKLARAMREHGVQTYQQNATKEESIKLYIKKYPEMSKELNIILELRERETLLSRYQRAKLDPHGRFRARFHPFTDTGRTASTAHHRGFGSNIQNIPHSERVYFIPDKGFVWWESDASQIEARITARWFYDEGYILDFDKPCPDCKGAAPPDCPACEGRGKRDVHLQSARQLFQDRRIPRSAKIKKTPWTYRDVGKVCVHLMNYCGTEYALANIIAIKFPGFEFDRDIARRFITIFRTHRSGVVAGWERVKDGLRRSRRMQTPYGRVRWFHDRMGDALFRHAIAWGPQSIAADHIAGVYGRVHREIEARKRKGLLHPQTAFLLQVHDSVAGQCLPDELEIIRDEIVLPAMAEPIPVLYKDQPLICPADFGSGPNWGAAK